MGPIVAKCEVYVNWKWVPKDFTTLKKGDVYRLYQPDGKTLSKSPDGEVVHRAMEDAKSDSTGFHWSVKCSNEKVDLSKL